MQNNLKKKDIAKELSKKTGFSKNYSNKLINDLIYTIINNIMSNELNLKNFGSFKLINKRERIGRNPKTGKQFTISSRKVVKFSVSKSFFNYINNF